MGELNRKRSTKSLRQSVLRTGWSGNAIHTRWQVKVISRDSRAGSRIGRMHQIGGILAVTLCLSASLFGQAESASDGTRVDQIQAERREKEAILTPEELSPGERQLTRIKHAAERLLQGNVHL